MGSLVRIQSGPPFTGGDPVVTITAILPIEFLSNFSPYAASGRVSPSETATARVSGTRTAKQSGPEGEEDGVCESYDELPVPLFDSYTQKKQF